MFLEKKHNKRGRLLLTMEYPPNKGGVGRYLESIVKVWPAGDIHVENAMFFKFFWPRWFKSVVIPFQLKPKELWISHLLPLGYIALIYKLVTGTPYRIFVHGTDIQFAAKSSWKNFWAKIILNQAKQIVVNSKYTLSLIINYKLQATSYKLIYPCPMFQASAPVAKKTHSLLSVGRLVPRKGFDAGIKAVVELKKIIQDIKYTIIGNGSEEEKLKALISRNNAGAYIKIITNADDQTLKNYYAQSEILLAPGREIDGDVEGFGLVILEAAQFATPAVATNIGGVGEAIVDGQTGVLLPNNNVETIVEVLTKLLRNDEYRRKLGQQAKDGVRQNFIMGEQIKKIF